MTLYNEEVEKHANDTKAFLEELRIEKIKENEKIIQIMPAPQNLYAVYENEENPSRDIISNVICLALTNQGNVWLLNADKNGSVDPVHSSANYKGIMRK